MSREAIKLALEALEYIHEGANNQGPHTGISWRCVSNKAESAITALREALAEQPAQQEPVAFYVYKPTLPRGNLGSVSDGDLPWVYDQDPSSGFSARMLVTPITSPPAKRKPLTDEEIICIEETIPADVNGVRPPIDFARAIEAAHGIKE